MTRKTLITTAVAIFAASTFATTASAQSIHCGGLNACKGQSACKTGASACKGMNACKGQGFLPAANAAECATKGGKVVP